MEPESHNSIDDIGPFYDTAGAQVMLGDISKQAVSQKVQQRRLLGLRLALEKPGHPQRVFPAWQFAPTVLRHLPAVLTAAGYDDNRPVTGWTIGHWLVNPTTDNGTSPIDLLRAGHSTLVIRLASEVAESLGVEERRAVIDVAAGRAQFSSLDSDERAAAHALVDQRIAERAHRLRFGDQSD